MSRPASARKFLGFSIRGGKPVTVAPGLDDGRPGAMGALLLAALVFCATAPRARAETSPLAQLNLDELMKVEITSVARKAQPLGNVAAAVHVIQREDILRSGARSVAEALRLAPGMDVAQISNSYHAVTARGFNGRYADKLQVLVDGRSVYWEMFSGVLWEAERVPLDDIERIEVIRGPAGALWGTNAVNGVVNIITRSAQDTPGTRVRAYAGSGDDLALTAQHGWRAGDDGPHWRVHLHQERNGDQSTVPGQNANDHLSVSSAGVRADWLWSDGSHLMVSADALQSRSGAVWRLPSLTPPYVDLGRLRQVYERVTLNATYDRTLSPQLALATQASLAVGDGRIGSLGHYHGRSASFDSRVNWHLSPRHDIVLGVGGRWTGSSFDTPPMPVPLFFDPAYRTMTEWGLYAQDEMVLAERWRLTLGGRMDRHSVSGNNAQPSARLLWNATDKTSMWAAVSRAARVPSRIDEDATAALAVIPPGTPGNPGPLPVLLTLRRPLGNLRQAESVEALELGWRSQLLPTLSLDMAGFANRYRHMALDGSPRAPSLVSAPQPYLVSSLSLPLGTLHTSGLETALDWRVTPTWRQQASWSFMRLSAASRAATTQALSPPAHVLMLRSALDLPAHTTLDAMLRYVGARERPVDPAGRIPSRWDLDLNLVWQATPNVALSLGGHNLLHGNRVELIPDYGVSEPTRIHRTVGVGLRIRLP